MADRPGILIMFGWVQGGIPRCRRPSLGERGQRSPVGVHELAMLARLGRVKPRDLGLQKTTGRGRDRRSSLMANVIMFGCGMVVSQRLLDAGVRVGLRYSRVRVPFQLLHVHRKDRRFNASEKMRKHEAQDSRGNCHSG